MWIVAGVLLGAVVLLTVAGLHIGPHGHGLAAVVGVCAAAWLVVMAVRGLTEPLVFGLLGADLALSAGLGALAWKGLTESSRPSLHLRRPIGSSGVAISVLEPVGVVRVAGEEWSAESLSGDIAAGTKVQVVGREGVRLQVWAEDLVPLPGRPLELGDLLAQPRSGEGNRGTGTAGGGSAPGGDESEAAES